MYKQVAMVLYTFEILKGVSGFKSLTGGWIGRSAVGWEEKK